MTKNYEELVNDVVKVDDLYSLTRGDIIELLLEAKPIWFDGHFELLSKRHSDSFFRFALITQHPYLMAKISKEMLGWIKKNSDLDKIDVVLSTSRAGMLLAYDIARELNGSSKTRAVYAKCDDSTGYPTDLQDGFTIKRNERVLVVNDLTTTGEALQKLIVLAEGNGGKVAGVCVFATRGESSPKIEKIRDKYKFHSIIKINFESWVKDKCPLCAGGEAFVFSRDLNSLTMTKTIAEVLKPLIRLNIGKQEILNSGNPVRHNMA